MSVENIATTMRTVVTDSHVAFQKRTISYASWVVLQRRATKILATDFCVYVYCTYDRVVEVSTGIVQVAG